MHKKKKTVMVAKALRTIGHRNPNVIYKCGAGHRSSKPGEHTGPKTHKWDIDLFKGREEEEEEKKKLYLTMMYLLTLSSG